MGGNMQINRIYHFSVSWAVAMIDNFLGFHFTHQGYKSMAGKVSVYELV